MAPADGKCLPTSRGHRRWRVLHPKPGWFIHVSISEQTNQQNTYNHIIMYDSCIMYINISLYVHLSFELASKPASDSCTWKPMASHWFSTILAPLRGGRVHETIFINPHRKYGIWLPFITIIYFIDMHREVIRIWQGFLLGKQPKAQRHWACPYLFQALLSPASQAAEVEQMINPDILLLVFFKTNVEKQTWNLWKHVCLTTLYTNIYKYISPILHAGNECEYMWK